MSASLGYTILLQVSIKTLPSNVLKKNSLAKAGQKLASEEIVTRRSLRPVCVWDTTRYN